MGEAEHGKSGLLRTLNVATFVVSGYASCESQPLPNPSEPEKTPRELPFASDAFSAATNGFFLEGGAQTFHLVDSR